MGRIILGLVITAVGVFIIVKTESILSNFGRIEFFERHLGTEGGSRLGYKLVGMLTIFIGMMIMTNMIGGLMEWILSPLLKYSQPINK
jgi:hypothetical protein